MHVTDDTVAASLRAAFGTYTHAFACTLEWINSN